VPRFAFEKFKQADDRLTTQMKSVGEVLAVGRSFTPIVGFRSDEISGRTFNVNESVSSGALPSVA
jgi:carbamoyl-phosphate synthase large subunit